MSASKQRRRAFWFVLAGLVLSGLIGGRILFAKEQLDPLGTTPTPGTYTLTLHDQGHDRVAVIHLPPALAEGRKLPLVLALHGAGGDGRQFMDAGGWREKGDQEGFIVVAPTGLPRNLGRRANILTNPNVWNSGQFDEDDSPRLQIDDVTYLVRLLDELNSRLRFDADRVYSVGHSNGGGMTYRLAAERSNLFRAIATVAGVIAPTLPAPSRPVPTLYIHGELDPVLPREGGESRLQWGKRVTLPVREYLSQWAKKSQCSEEARVESAGDGLTRLTFLSTQQEANVTAIFIEGEGHDWPGGKGLLPERIMGPRTHRFNATDEIWKYFKQVTEKREVSAKSSP
jgi:polyhydroxybutyrate depolymerase